MRRRLIYFWLFGLISFAAAGQNLEEKSASGSRNILLLPDYYGGTEVFEHRFAGRSLVRQLERAGFRVWALSWGGVPGGFDSDDAVASVASAVEKILSENPGDLVLCGLGWGGTVAGNYAVQDPDKVERLILLDPVFTGRGKFDELPEAPAGALPEVWRELHVSGSVWLLNPGVLRVPTLLVAMPVATGRNAALEAILLLPAGSELVTAGMSDGGLLNGRDNVEIVLSSVDSFLGKALPARERRSPASEPEVSAVSEYQVESNPEIDGSVETAAKTEVPPAGDTSVEPAAGQDAGAEADAEQPSVDRVEESSGGVSLPEADDSAIAAKPPETPVPAVSGRSMLEHEEWYNQFRAALALSDVHDCAGAAALGGKVAPSRNAPGVLADRHAVIKLLRGAEVISDDMVLYLSDGPCAYCAGAIRYAGIKKVVVTGKLKANRAMLEELSESGVEIEFLEK